MSRQLVGLLVGAALVARVGTARAGAEAEAEVAAEASQPASEQEVGGFLGLALGGRTTAGGLALSGDYLYQLSDHDWLDSGVGFRYGAGGAACFRDRDNQVRCDHGLTDGFAAGLVVGVRHFFPGQGQFVPFARLRLGVEVVSFSGDDLRGVALPLELGGGVRARVAEHVTVVGGADLALGLAHFGGGVGGEPQLGLRLLGGVEFGLD
jgi:hypothetical protein